MARGKKQTAFPLCDKHDDCFALKDGRCVCLSDNDFGEGGFCPYYKPNTEVDMDEILGECKAYAATHGGSGKAGE